MTGDYDLMAVCPRWGNYGSRSVAEIEKPGVAFAGKGAPAGQTTLKNLGEFREYATLLNEAGYFVPRNWTWGMSVRDRVHTTPWRA